MAGPSIATWVKVKTKTGFTTRPISNKYEGGSGYEPGQVITQSEYNQIKANRKEKEKGGEKAIAVADKKTQNAIDRILSSDITNEAKVLKLTNLAFKHAGSSTNQKAIQDAIASQPKTSPKAAIASQSKRVKTPEQVSAQSSRIVEKIRGRIEKLKDKRGQSTDKANQLEQQLKDGKTKVTTSKKLKSSSDYTDVIKSNKALNREIASTVSGNPDSQYVKRQKMNKKQIQDLHDKINEEYGKAFGYQDRIKQLQKLGQNVSSKIY